MRFVPRSASRSALLAAGFLCLSAGLAAGATTKAELRALVLAHEFDAAEAALDAAHDAPDAARTGYGAERALFTVFNVTDPKIEEATRAWRAARPDSAIAKVARGWYLFGIGWAVRGHRYAAYTYPPAMQALAQLHEQAHSLGQEAWDARPGFVSASDLVLRTERTAPRRDGPGVPELLARIMKEAPSSGSLYRAAAAMAPNWGGSVEQMLDPCARYADKLPDKPGYSYDYCFIDVVFDNGVQGEVGRRAVRLLKQTDDDKGMMDSARFRWLRNLPDGYTIPAEYAALVAARLANPKIVDVQLAMVFSRTQPGGMIGPIWRKAAERRIARLRALVPTDPYNPDLMRALTDGLYRSTRLKGAPDDHEALGFLHRALAMAQYDPDLWQRYAETLHRSRRVGGDSALDAVAAAEPFLANAVVYGNHAPQDLIAYFERLSTGQADWMRHSPHPGKAERARADRVLICPLIRATRLLQASCDARRWDKTCQRLSFLAPAQQRLTASAELRGSCLHERTAGVEALLFTPQEVTWQDDAPAIPASQRFVE